MDEGEFSNAVICGAFVVGETNMEVGGGHWVAEKGRLIQETAVFVIIEEILLYECEGLTSAGALGDTCKG